MPLRQTSFASGQVLATTAALVNLQRAARAVVAEFGGRFPGPCAAASIAGIGAYTAGAIAAFAYEQDVAFVDTNMRRVINR